MKTIQLLATTTIAGMVRQPQEGPIVVDDEHADALIESKMAVDSDVEAEVDEDEDLEALTLPDLGILATKEGVPLNGATKKADIIAAIQTHRESKAG